MEQKNSLRTELGTALTPAQMHSLAILAAPVMELDAKINAELEKNPMLEIDESAPEPAQISDAGEISGQPGCEKDDLEDELAKIVDLSVSGAMRSEREPQEEGQDFSELEERRQYMFDSIAAETSLEEQLLEQLRLSDAAAAEARIAEDVIGGLDENGYLVTHPADIAMANRCSLEDVEKAVRLVQTFEPRGIAARDLKECLLLQLEPDMPDCKDLKDLIENHLEEISRNKIPQAAAEMGISVEKLNGLVNTVRRFNPRPGRSNSVHENEYIVPEMTVTPDGEGGFRLTADSERVPRIKISDEYLKLLEDPATDRETRDYIRNRLTDGKGLINALKFRESTIKKISSMILSEQYDFFRDGTSALRPLTMQRVADKLGVDESTVSRALSGKYLSTPQGIFPYKYFFTGGFSSGSGEELSSRAVKEKIEKIIDGEDPAKPLSDNDVTELLRGEGIDIKRRTVAKYREELKIPKSNLRRSFG